MSGTDKIKADEARKEEKSTPRCWIANVSLAATILYATCGAWAVERTEILLRDNWYIRQLETDKPAVAALTKEAASPDNTWLPARMPAQVHDVLLQHGKIPDPHVSRNAADFGSFPKRTLGSGEAEREGDGRSSGTAMAQGPEGAGRGRRGEKGDSSF